MGSLNFILTADYELFGDGSGCIKKCMIDPAEKMLSICDKYFAKLTLFVDVCEYWAFKEAANKNLFDNEEFPHVLIEQQLQDAVRRGHDVQLHFHPQWLDAEYIDGKWKLNNDFWRLPSVENHPKWTLIKLFKEGKATLENIIKPIDPDYKCNIFRAGAWCIQDELKVLEAMRENHFIIDSTVAPNMLFDNGLTYYDFRNAPKKHSWNIKDNVIKEDSFASIKEVPIFTTEVLWFTILYFKFLKVLKTLPFKSSECVSASVNTGSRYSLKGLFKNQYRMFNFCDATSFRELKYFTKKANLAFEKLLDTEDVPVVIIGHPKTFGNEIEFERFLNWATKERHHLFGKYQ